MFQQMKKRIKNEKGLTLIELLAVIVILAIVAAIAIPAIGNIIENSRVKGAKADIANVVSGANIYFTEYSVDTATFGGTNPTEDAAQFISNLGTVKELTVTKTEGQITFGGTVTINDEDYTIEDGTTLNVLKVDKGDVEGDGFND